MVRSRFQLANSTGVKPIFTGILVEVAVDTETGKVDFLRCTSLIDASLNGYLSSAEGKMKRGTQYMVSAVL